MVSTAAPAAPQMSAATSARVRSNPVSPVPAMISPSGSPLSSHGNLGATADGDRRVPQIHIGLVGPVQRVLQRNRVLQETGSILEEMNHVGPGIGPGVRRATPHSP